MNSLSPFRFHMVLAVLAVLYVMQQLSVAFDVAASILPGLIVLAMLLFTAVLWLHIKQLPASFKQALWHNQHQNEGHHSAFSMSLMLLGLLFVDSQLLLATAIWFVGAGLQLIITSYVVKGWLYCDHWQMQDLTPDWFLPISGLLMVSWGMQRFISLELGWMLFSIGLILWLILFSLMLYRLFFLPLLSNKQQLSFFILAAPPALAFLSYVQLNQLSSLDLVARLLFYSSLFLSLLLLTQVKRFIQTPFCFDWWRLPFPFALMTLASLQMYQLLDQALFIWLSALFLFISISVILHLSVRSAMLSNSLKQH